MFDLYIDYCKVLSAGYRRYIERIEATVMVVNLSRRSLNRCRGPQNKDEGTDPKA